MPLECTCAQNEKDAVFLGKYIQKVLKILVMGKGPLKNKTNLQLFGTGGLKDPYLSKLVGTLATTSSGISLTKIIVHPPDVISYIISQHWKMNMYYLMGGNVVF